VSPLDNPSTLCPIVPSILIFTFVLVPPPPAITEGVIEKLPPDCSGEVVVSVAVNAALAGNASLSRHESPPTPSTGRAINEGTNVTKKTIPIRRSAFRKPEKLGERRTEFINPP
jgi:hypothetical protein